MHIESSFRIDGSFNWSNFAGLLTSKAVNWFTKTPEIVRGFLMGVMDGLKGGVFVAACSLLMTSVTLQAYRSSYYNTVYDCKTGQGCTCNLSI